jgi:hypothetical protein
MNVIQYVTLAFFSSLLLFSSFTAKAGFSCHRKYIMLFQVFVKSIAFLFRRCGRIFFYANVNQYRFFNLIEINCIHCFGSEITLFSYLFFIINGGYFTIVARSWDMHDKIHIYLIFITISMQNI